MSSRSATHAHALAPRSWPRQLGGLLPDLAPMLAAILLLSVTFRSGYLLGRDMVFTPDQPLNYPALGLGTGSARAVPLDALTALGSRVLGGAVLGRLAVLTPLLAAGWGCRRLAALLGWSSLPAGLAAAILAVWNPFVIERLALGQWALLWCYAALPWIFIAGAQVRESDRRGLARAGAWAALLLGGAAAAITPTGAIIGGIAVVVAVAARPPAALRRTFGALALAVILQLPWLLPSLLGQSTATSDPAGVAAFAARSERPGGVLLSLLGLGGIWDASATPGSRSGALGYLCTVLVVAGLAGLGMHACRSVSTRRRVIGLGVAGLALAAVPVVPGGGAALRWAVSNVPGAGLLRDGQKWLLPFVVVAVLGVAAVADAAAERASVGRIQSRHSRVALAVAAIAMPVLLLPDAAQALRPTFTPAHYPAGWLQARSMLADRRQDSGAVLALPYSEYRTLDFVTAPNVIDPLPRLLPRPVVTDDRLAVGGTVLRGEDRFAATIGALLTGPAPVAGALARHGIGWVWVDHGTSGPPLPDLAGLEQIYQDPAVSLYRVPGPIGTLPRSSDAASAAVIATDIAVLSLAIVALLTALGARSLAR